jgi:hypothetical protein
MLGPLEIIVMLASIAAVIYAIRKLFRWLINLINR